MVTTAQLNDLYAVYRRSNWGGLGSINDCLVAAPTQKAADELAKLYPDREGQYGTLFIAVEHVPCPASLKSLIAGGARLDDEGDVWSMDGKQCLASPSACKVSYWRVSGPCRETTHDEDAYITAYYAMVKGGRRG